MSTALKITQIGNSLGVILPKEMLAHLKVGKGDSLFVTEVPDGVALRPYDEQFEQQMALAREIMKKRRAVLRELAKSAAPRTTPGSGCPPTCCSPCMTSNWPNTAARKARATKACSPRPCHGRNTWSPMANPTPRNWPPPTPLASHATSRSSTATNAQPMWRLNCFWRSTALR